MRLSKLLRSAPARPTWLGCQSAWLHFRSVLTAKDLKFASTLLLCLDCQRPDVPLPHFRSALTGKDLKFHVRTFVLHWLPKMWSSASASALPLCLYCQICEALLPRFRSAFTGKDLKFRFPHLFCQDFQRCEVPLPHFISAWTSKD